MIFEIEVLYMLPCIFLHLRKSRPHCSVLYICMFGAFVELSDYDSYVIVNLLMCTCGLRGWQMGL